MTFRERMVDEGTKVLRDDYVTWRGCARKRRYAKYSDAKDVQDRTKHGKAYYCEHCFGYHVGHDNAI